MSSPARKSGRQAKPTEKLKDYLHDYEEKSKKESKLAISKAGNAVSSKEKSLNSSKRNKKNIKKCEMIDLQISPARKSGREAKPTEKLREYLHHDNEMTIKLNNKSAIEGHNQKLEDASLKPVITIETVVKKRKNNEMSIKLNNKFAKEVNNQKSKDAILKPIITIQTVVKKRKRPIKVENESEDNGKDVNRKKFKKGKENYMKKATVQYPCGVCGSEVRNSSVWCTGCLKWCHKRCSGLKSLNKVAEYYKCPSCLKENIKNIIVKLPEKEKKTKIIPDTKIYVVPKGWRRQAVKRMGGMHAGKFDVYYYSPQGSKLRSLKEVENYCEKQGIEIDLSQFSFTHSEKGRLSLMNAGLPITPMKLITPKTPKDKEIKETRGRPRGSTKFKKKVDTSDAIISNEDQSTGKPVELSDFMDIYNNKISSPEQNVKTDTIKRSRGRPRGSTKSRNEEADCTVRFSKKDLSPAKMVEPKEYINGGTSPKSSPDLRKLRLVDNLNKSKHAAMTNSVLKEDHSKIKKNLNLGVEGKNTFSTKNRKSKKSSQVSPFSVSPSVVNSPVTKSGRQVKPTEKLKESTIPTNHAENEEESGAETLVSMSPSVMNSPVTKSGRQVKPTEKLKESIIPINHAENEQTKHPKSLLASKKYNQVLQDLSKNKDGSPNWDLAFARMAEVYTWVNTAPEEMKKKVHELTLRFFSCIEILQSKHRTSLPTQELVNV